MSKLQKTRHQVHLTPEFVFDRIPTFTHGGKVKPLEIAEAWIDCDGNLVLDVIGEADPDEVSFGDKDAA